MFEFERDMLSTADDLSFLMLIFCIELNKIFTTKGLQSLSVEMQKNENSTISLLIIQQQPILSIFLD